MSATLAARYEDVSASWDEPCEEEQAADTNTVCEYDYYDESAVEWEDEDVYSYYYTAGFDAYGRNGAWTTHFADKETSFQVPTSAKLCRNGKFCHFHAHGNCKYFHPEEEDSSVAQEASSRQSTQDGKAKFIPQSNRLQADLQDLRNQLHVLLTRLPDRKKTLSVSSKALALPARKQAQARRISSVGKPIVIDLSESRSRSRSPVNVSRRRAESDEDTQDSDEVLAEALHSAFSLNGRGVAKLGKDLPAQRRGRVTARRRVESLSSEPIMAPIVQ